jgi:nucleotide-binding universal stress UspA family protein
MFKNILVPTDLTDRAAHTIEVLKGLIGDAPVKVTLLHVVEQIPQTNPEEFRDFYSGLEERSAAKLASLAALLERPTIDVARNVIYGHPAAEIARFAESQNIDLIALASHAVDPTQPGRGWGTLSYKIGMLAACPVLLVK